MDRQTTNVPVFNFRNLFTLCYRGRERHRIQCGWPCQNDVKWRWGLNWGLRNRTWPADSSWRAFFMRFFRVGSGNFRPSSDNWTQCIATCREPLTAVTTLQHPQAAAIGCRGRSPHKSNLTRRHRERDKEGERQRERKTQRERFSGQSASPEDRNAAWLSACLIPG